MREEVDDGGDRSSTQRAKWMSWLTCRDAASLMSQPARDRDWRTLCSVCRAVDSLDMTSQVCTTMLAADGQESAASEAIL